MRYLLPVLPLLYQILPTLAQDDSQPLPLPAMSFENSKLLMKVDEETGEWAKSILDASDFCPHKDKLRRAMLSGNPLEKRAFDEALRDCYVAGAEVLASTKDFVSHFAGYIAESHIPEIERVLEEGKTAVPNFLDETMAAAIPIVLEVFAPYKPPTVEKKHDPFVVLGLASMAIIHLVDRVKLAKGMWDLGVRGGMGNQCPTQEIDCGDRLCQGTDGLCSPAEFLGGGRQCECKSHECPDPNKNPDDTKFFCGNPGCGEATLEGVCEGQEPKFKGCYCANPGDELPYDMSSDQDRFQRIIDGTEEPINDPGDPPPSGGPPSGNGKTECRRDTISGDYESADEWKFVKVEILLENIDTFCNELQIDGDNIDYVRDFQSPPDGKHDKQYFREWDHNWVVISIGWGEKPEIDAEGCRALLRKITDNCDWSPEPEDKNPNWYQWKWGGVHTDNSYRVEIIPQTPRARKEVPDERSGGTWWWWDDDKSKGYKRREDSLPRIGKNGQIWDLLIIHQCLHGIRDFDWRGDHKTTDCAGFVSMSKDAHMFWPYNKPNPAQDLWDETWEIFSYEILKTDKPAISGYSNNKRGGGERAWMGIDPYDMPPLVPEDQRTGPLSHGFG